MSDGATRQQMPAGGPHRQWREAVATGGIPARRAVGLVAALVVLMLAGGAATALVSGGSPQAGRLQLAGTSETVPVGGSGKMLPASDAALMGLQGLGRRQAPGFSLTDQHGRPISLSGLLRHQAVVLTFMDDRCTDVCPLVAQELADAYRDLGPRAAAVAFVAVNVNAGHWSTKWLRSFVDAHAPSLASVSDFYYLTGAPAALRHVWAAYGVHVLTTPSGGVVHGNAMYFIARSGRMVYDATPFANMRPNGTGWLPPATITQWGQGIARYAEVVSR